MQVEHLVSTVEPAGWGVGVALTARIHRRECFKCALAFGGGEG